MSEARAALAVQIKDQTRRGAIGAARSLDSIKRKAREADTSVKRFGKSLSGVGARFSVFQRAAAGGIGFTALAAAVGEAVRQFEAFEKAMAEVSTLISDLDQMEVLTKNVRELSKEFGTDQIEQAKALYQTISAGATDAAEATATLTAANTLALGGVTTVTVAVDGLTTVLNAFGEDAGTATDVSDRMFVAMKAGKTTIGELSQSLSFIAPVASQTGVSLDEVLAATAALTKAGVPTQRAMRGLAQTIATIIKPASEAKAMADELGLQFNAAALAAKGLRGFLQDVAEKTGGSAEKMAQLFGGVESLIPALSLTGKQAKDFGTILDDMATSAGESEKAFKKMAKTQIHQMNLLKAEYNDFATQAGSAITNVLLAILEADRVGSETAASFGFFKLHDRGDPRLTDAENKDQRAVQESLAQEQQDRFRLAQKRASLIDDEVLRRQQQAQAQAQGLQRRDASREAFRFRKAPQTDVAGTFPTDVVGLEASIDKMLDRIEAAAPPVDEFAEAMKKIAEQKEIFSEFGVQAEINDTVERLRIAGMKDGVEKTQAMAKATRDATLAAFRKKGADRAQVTQLEKVLVAEDKRLESLKDTADATKVNTEKSEQLWRIYDESARVLERLVPNVGNFFDSLKAFANKDPIGGTFAAINGLLDVFGAVKLGTEGLTESLRELERTTRDISETRRSILQRLGGDIFEGVATRVTQPIADLFAELQQATEEMVLTGGRPELIVTKGLSQLSAIQELLRQARALETGQGGGSALGRAIGDLELFKAQLNSAFGSDSIAQAIESMLEVSGAFDNVTAAGKRVASTSEEIANRLRFRGQEISAGARFSEASRRAGGDVFLQRRALLDFNRVVQSIRKSQQLAESRLSGGGLPSAAVAGGGAAAKATAGAGAVAIGNLGGITPVSVASAEVFTLLQSPLIDFLASDSYSDLIDWVGSIVKIGVPAAHAVKLKRSKLPDFLPTNSYADLILVEGSVVKVGVVAAHAIKLIQSPITAYMPSNDYGDLVRIEGNVKKVPLNASNVIDIQAMEIEPEDVVEFASPDVFWDHYNAPDGLLGRIGNGLPDALEQHKTNVAAHTVKFAATDFMELPSESAFNDFYRQPPDGLLSRIGQGMTEALHQHVVNVSAHRINFAARDFMSLPGKLDFFFKWADMVNDMTFSLEAIFDRISLPKLKIKAEDIVEIEGDISSGFRDLTIRAMREALDDREFENPQANRVF